MSTTKRIGIFIVVVCGLMGSTFAEDGNGLLEDCQKYLGDEQYSSYTDSLKAGICAGYLLGVTDTVELWDQWVAMWEASKKTHCLPEAAEFDQLAKVVVKYLEDNPADLHLNASFLVQLAFMEAFPCTEGGGQ